MSHYSKTNIEKLTEFWLLLEGEMKQKKMAKKFETLLSHQNAFHDSLATVVSDYETECDRIEKKASNGFSRQTRNRGKRGMTLCQIALGTGCR